VQFVLTEPLEARLLFTIPGTTLGSYHTYASIGTDLHAMARTYPLLTKLVSIGKSGEDRDIWALKISDHPNLQEDEPELRFVGAIHGDEPIGMENTFAFATDLLEKYGLDPRITKLVDGTEIWLIPNMNPDGLEAHQRGNASGLDLNRSFPEGSTHDIGNIFSGPALDTTGREPETAAMMRFSAANSFTLSANLHAGTMVVNYPYDSNGNGVPDDALCPDDALFREVALVYSKSNTTMYNSWEFPKGITNGDAWYEVHGGLQDWSYRYLSDNHVTIELSYDKRPEESELPSLYEENRESMMQFAETVHWGVRGVVTRTSDGTPVFAKVAVAANSQPVYTDPAAGDFHRMLLPGNYAFTFSAPGYETQTIRDVEVITKTTDAALTTRLNVALVPSDQTAPGVVASRYEYNANPTAVTFKFDEDVGASIGADDVQLVDSDGKTVDVAFTASWDAQTGTASYMLPKKPPHDGNYRLRLLASRVRDAWGNAMAETVSTGFYVLAGDANRDRKVDSTDASILASHFGFAGKFSDGDFNYSGVVDSRDFNLLLSRFGKHLAPPLSVANVPAPAAGIFAAALTLDSTTEVLT
jgi:carboxypeptidase D